MIRNADKNDVEALLETERFHSLDIPQFIESDMLYYFDYYLNDFFVYECNNRIIGYIYGKIINQLIHCNCIDLKGNKWLQIVGFGIVPGQEDKLLTLIYRMLEHASSLDLQGCLLIDNKKIYSYLKKLVFNRIDILNIKDGLFISLIFKESI